MILKMCVSYAHLFHYTFVSTLKSKSHWTRRVKRKIKRFLFPFVKDIIVVLSMWKLVSKKENEATEKAPFYNSVSLSKVY